MAATSGDSVRNFQHCSVHRILEWWGLWSGGSVSNFHW